MGGKKQLFPAYITCQMCWNVETWLKCMPSHCRQLFAVLYMFRGSCTHLLLLLLLSAATKVKEKHCKCQENECYCIFIVFAIIQSSYRSVVINSRSAYDRKPSFVYCMRDSFFLAGARTLNNLPYCQR